MINWLRKHRFETHFISFSLMLMVSIGMYVAVFAGAVSLIWILLGIFVLANVIAMVVR